MTTLRVSEATKRYLEFFGRAGETHDEMLSRILNILKHKDIETQVFRKNNVLGTKYGRKNKTLNVKIDEKMFSIVCTYNDLSPWVILKDQEKLLEQLGKDWEMDLEIVNIKTNPEENWNDPNITPNQDKKTYPLLHFIILKELLEEYFDIRIYEISTTKDYLNYDLWKQTYLRNKLSMESFHKDVERQLK